MKEGRDVIAQSQSGTGKTAVAELVAVLLKEMGFGDCVTAPSPILGDNDQTTRWSIERMVTTGNKCIRTDYHWVKECVQLGDICPRRVSTENNISDIFTKPLGRAIFMPLRDQLINLDSS